MSQTEALNYIDLPYTVDVVQEQYEDGRICYLASHPELPGCMSHGDTRDDAVRSLRDARQMYIESLLQDGLEIPLPVAQEIPEPDHAPGKRAPAAVGPTR